VRTTSASGTQDIHHRLVNLRENEKPARSRQPGISTASGARKHGSSSFDVPREKNKACDGREEHGTWQQKQKKRGVTGFIKKADGASS
jgi:hypothetical protein